MGQALLSCLRLPGPSVSEIHFSTLYPLSSLLGPKAGRQSPLMLALARLLFPNPACFSGSIPAWVLWAHPGWCLTGFHEASDISKLP